MPILQAFVDEEVISVEEFGPFEHFICLGIYLHNGGVPNISYILPYFITCFVYVV